MSTLTLHCVDSRDCIEQGSDIDKMLWSLFWLYRLTTFSTKAFTVIFSCNCTLLSLGIYSSQNYMYGVCVVTLTIVTGQDATQEVEESSQSTHGPLQREVSGWEWKISQLPTTKTQTEDLCRPETSEETRVSVCWNPQSNKGSSQTWKHWLHHRWNGTTITQWILLLDIW